MTPSVANDLLPPMNQVFVDFENVQDVDLSVIGSKGMSFTFLLGANQTKLKTDLVEKLIEHAAAIQMVRLSSSGKNALDFALAYYLGRAVLADPGAHFHVISKDTGFDSLIGHLKSRNIRARRHKDFTTLPHAAGKPTPAPQVDPLVRVLEHIRKNATNRPKRKKTLTRHVLGLLGKEATEESASAVILELCKTGNLILDEKDAVTYRF